MPVIMNENSNKKYPHQAICDYCGQFHGFWNEDALIYSGYGIGKPKFPIICNVCNEKFYNLHQQPPTEILNMSNNTRRTLVNKADLSTTIQWDTVEKLIADGTSLKSLSESLNTSSNALKDLLIEKYGEKIKFMRGRTGGIKMTA